MAKKLQLRGGSTSDHGSFTGAVREVTVDTDLKTLRVHDGSTAGGTRLAKFSEIAAGSLNNVVEDTTPQLGGTLDAQSNNITSLGTVNGHTIPGGTGTFALTSNITFTASSSDTLTNKSGNISMFTNDSGYITGISAGTGIDVSGTVIGLETDLRDGIVAIGLDNNDYMGIGTDQFNWFINGGNEMRLESDGDLHVDGDVIAYSTTVSDVALKTDIEMIPNALDKIDEVRGVTFTRHNGQKSAGIIAQELEKVLPEAVREKTLALVDGKTYKTVEYDAIHGLLINCIKAVSYTHLRAHET